MGASYSLKIFKLYYTEIEFSPINNGFKKSHVVAFPIIQIHLRTEGKVSFAIVNWWYWGIHQLINSNEFLPYSVACIISINRIVVLLTIYLEITALVSQFMIPAFQFTMPEIVAFWWVYSKLTPNFDQFFQPVLELQEGSSR